MGRPEQDGSGNQSCIRFYPPTLMTADAENSKDGNGPSRHRRRGAIQYRTARLPLVSRPWCGRLKGGFNHDRYWVAAMTD